LARILGLDVGHRRIGLAISDPDERLAVPLRVLECAGGDRDIQAIIEIAIREHVTVLVVGLPRSLDGTVGQQAQRVQLFARRLAEASGLPIEFWDERLTSVQAERPPPPDRKRRAPRTKSRTRTPADDIAAAIILQAFLDRRANARLPSEP
jgi:putative Holliday junction resolvase